MHDTLHSWWDNHHNLGGSVYTVDYPITQLGDVPHLTDTLLNKFSNIKASDILDFITADVFDNTMPQRETLEDASKVLWLANEIKANGLKYPCILLHQYWEHRYRVHPGSGRVFALHLAGHTHVPCVYYHFNMPGFVVPDNATKLKTVSELSNYVGDEAQWEVYSAFNESYRTKDPHWNPNVSTSTQWEFLWFSEGTQFASYKQAWRDHALEAWYMLQNNSK